jgi:hypothetical protein
MDLYEWIGFVAIGFIPTLAGLEITWRITTKRLRSSRTTRSPEVEVVVEDKRKAVVTEEVMSA